MAAALLRKLLSDEKPLIYEINKNRRLKLRFTLANMKPLDVVGLYFWTVQDGFDPDTALVRVSPITVNKEGLLKSTSMVIKGKVITVLALIRFLCHIQGTVHIGEDAMPKVGSSALPVLNSTIKSRDGYWMRSPGRFPRSVLSKIASLAREVRKSPKVV